MEAFNEVVSDLTSLIPINTLSLGVRYLKTAAPPTGKPFGRLVVRDPVPVTRGNEALRDWLWA
jgi:hypothetical protein